MREPACSGRGEIAIDIHQQVGAVAVGIEGGCVLAARRHDGGIGYDRSGVVIEGGDDGLRLALGPDRQIIQAASGRAAR